MVVQFLIAKNLGIEPGFKVMKKFIENDGGGVTMVSHLVIF